VFCRARHERFRESEALRRVFEGVVAKCIAAGLVGGEALSVDASLIKADVDKKKRMPGDQPIAWPKAEEASRAVREYLTALDNARTDEENDGRDGDDSGSGGGRRRKPPKEVSLTDPQAAWVARKGTDPLFAYDANYLIDNKAGIIVDAEGTRANRIAEIAVAQTMLERVRHRFGLQPQRLAGDSVYGAVRVLKWLWIARLRRTFRCGTGRRDLMGPSAEPTLSSTTSATSISAPAVQNSPAPATSIRVTSSTTEPTRAIALPAR
jgi:hypothetical protein